MLRKFLKSFVYAFQGLRVGLNERNMRFHLFATVVVIFLGTFFSISLLDWALVFLCIGSVLGAELFNTAIEEICDLQARVDPDIANKMGKPKDLAAGAVLMFSFFSFVIGVLIFLPHLIEFFRR